ncbi:MAG: LPS-assembly protein LptD, partial [Cytophagales bacterium]|nr:LPS-assembly protein LptD [Cytophaga sp.]
DTSGTENATKKVKLLENLSGSGNYNFTADSLKLSVIQLNARSRFFDKVDFNFTTTLDPYTYVLDSVRGSNTYQRRVNTFAYEKDHKIAIMTNYNISLSTNFNPNGQKSQQPANINNPNGNTYVVGGADQYVDFNIPWNLFLSYNLNYNKIGYAPTSIAQALTFSGDINISDNWKIKATSGYDFLKNSLTYTTIQIFRDLHCWQMSLNIVPFGQRQSFFFTINAKSSLLKDLKITKQSSTYFGGY